MGEWWIKFSVLMLVFVVVVWVLAVFIWAILGVLCEWFGIDLLARWKKRK